MTTQAAPGSRRRSALALGAGAVFLGLLVFDVLSVNGMGDYGAGRGVGGDNAEPGLAALVHGSLAGYFSHQPVMGLTSILIRLPFFALASTLRLSALGSYQLSTLACLLPLALLAVWLAGAKNISADRRAYGLAGLMILIISPILQNALDAGHPEGVLAATLGAAAVIAATRGRVRTAAVLLGLAIGSQDWALMAVPPVVVAARGRRREVLLLAGAVAAPLTVCVWLADPAGFLRAAHSEGATRFLTPLSLLWPLSIPLHLTNGGAEWVRAMPLGMRRPEATLLSAGLVGLIGGTWYLSVRRRVIGFEPLALLALLGLLRCVCDSTHEEYYAIAALIPVVAWEVCENRLPVFGALLCLRSWSTYALLGHVSATYLYVSSLGTKVLLVGYFARRAVALAPGVTVSSRPPEALSARVALHPAQKLLHAGVVGLAGRRNRLPATRDDRSLGSAEPVGQPIA